MLFLAGTTAILASCTQNEELDGGADATGAFQISVSDNGFRNTDGSTRAVENGYATKFVDGDAIGVFGVKGTAVVSDINNRKFTMQDGAWELDGNPIEYKSSEFKGMKFFAYYPYDESVAFNPADEDPFADYVSNWKVGNDQSEENYTSYDLMTSLGEAQGERLKGKVSFVMEHRMALAVLNKPEVTYDFTNEGVADYVLKADFKSFSLNGADATPYYEKSSDTYRFLLKPDVDNVIKNTYEGVKTMECEIKANLQKGASKLYTIDDENKFSQELAVGDYFCADGAIVSKAAGAPENAIGVVFYVGNPQPSVTHPEKVAAEKDALLRDYPGAVHGLVMAVNNTQADMTNIGGPNNTYTSFVSGDEDLSAKYTLCETKNALTDFPGYMGYNNTAILLLANEAYTDRYVSAVTQINNFREAVALPAGATPWYIPSQSELALIATCIETLNQSVSQAGGTELVQSTGTATGFYWSSTERNGNTQWVNGLKDDDGHVERRELGSRSGYFRLTFAF